MLISDMIAPSVELCIAGSLMNNTSLGIMSYLRVSVVKYAWSRHPKSAAATCKSFMVNPGATTVSAIYDCTHIADPGATAL